MSIVLVERGIPGSGKTTHAIALQHSEPGKWKRINRDSIRAMLGDDKKFTPANEKLVKEARDFLVRRALEFGWNVIIDDTNISLHSMHKELLPLAKGHTLKIVVHRTPLETCLARNAQRSPETRVPDNIIVNMHKELIRHDSDCS